MGNQTSSLNLIYSSLFESSSSTNNTLPLKSDLAQARALQADITRLTDQRTLILRQVNLHHSHTKEIPVELLSHIFRYVCKDFNEVTPFTTSSRDHQADIHNQLSVPLTIGAVCSLWRNIVYNTPQYWSKLYVKVNRSNLKQVMYLLRLHVHKCRKYLLHVELYFQDGHSRDMEKLYDLIYEKVSHRFKSIRLFDAPRTWANFRDKRKFPNLRSLTIGYSHTNRAPAAMNVQALPILSHISLYNFGPVHHYTLPWKQTTSLEMGSMHYDICIVTLRRCNNLRSIKVVETTPPIHDMKDNIYIAFMMQYLEHFEWTFPNEDFGHEMESILKNVRLPAVKKIVLRNLFANTKNRYDHLPTFFHRLPDSLQSLTFDMGRMYSIGSNRPNPQILPLEIEGYFKLIPQSVTQLRFEGISFDFVNDIFCGRLEHVQEEGQTKMRAVWKGREYGGELSIEVYDKYKERRPKV